MSYYFLNHLAKRTRANRKQWNTRRVMSAEICFGTMRLWTKHSLAQWLIDFIFTQKVAGSIPEPRGLKIFLSLKETILRNNKSESPHACVDSHSLRKIVLDKNNNQNLHTRVQILILKIQKILFKRE